jgi:diacylglycerol kinase family enzyme
VLRSRSFRIEAPRPLPVQIDGDVGGETPLDILVRPAAIRVIAPAAKRGT